MRSLFAVLWLLCSWSAQALETVRVGVLQFGTVQWELSAMQALKLDQAHGFQLEQLALAGKDATTVALRGATVDIIMTDWPWVSAQRQTGADYRFVTHSSAAGQLLVAANSPITTLAELRGKRLGVAGGALDKNWLILRRYAQQQGLDLERETQPQFAAPPLLGELLQRGELDGLLTFWHFAARAQAQGQRPLLSVQQMLSALGADEHTPLLGWVFSEAWAKQHPHALAGFLRASRATKQALLSDDQLWQTQIRPLMQVNSEAEFIALRDAYRRSIPAHVGPQDARAAELLNRVLANGEQLAPGTFWADYQD